MLSPMKTGASIRPLFLLGGGPGSRRDAPDPLLEEVFAATGTPHPRVAYVGAASGDNRSFFTWLARLFTVSGAGDVTLVPTANPKADQRKALAILEEADALFMTGGDVEVGMERLCEHSLITPLKQLREQGKLFFGLSAGSIMLSQAWIRWDDPDDDTTAHSFPCLGFAPVLCDMHAEEDDWVELKALLALHPPGTTGYGIPTGAGLKVENCGTLTALGGAVECYARTARGIKRLTPLTP